MKNKDLNNKGADENAKSKLDEIEEKRDQTFPGYPTYPADEDIMNRKDRSSLDVDKVTGSARINNELDREENDDLSELEEEDLDVPGSELDDENESIGEEDEENNYYSLGGDRHEDLDETNEDDV